MRIGVALGGIAFACIFSTSAVAEKPYISLHGGWSFPSAQTSDFDSPGTTPDGIGHIRTESETGYRFGGALGMFLNRYVSGELELTYAKHDVDTLSVFRNQNPGAGPAPGAWAGPFDGRGDAETLSGMINGFVSLPMDKIRPYVGVGFGVTHVRANGVGFAGVPGDTNDSANAFTWQLMGGVGVQLSPGLELGSRYRFQHVDAYELFNSAGDEQRIPKSEGHSFELTLTWAFPK